MQIIRLVSEQLPDIEIRGRVTAKTLNPAPSVPHGVLEMHWEVRDAEIPDALSQWAALPNIKGVVEVHFGGNVVRMTRGSGVQVMGGVVHIAGYAG